MHRMFFIAAAFAAAAIAQTGAEPVVERVFRVSLTIDGGFAA